MWAVMGLTNLVYSGAIMSVRIRFGPHTVSMVTLKLWGKGTFARLELSKKLKFD